MHNCKLTPEQPRVLILSNQAERACRRLWSIYRRDPVNLRAKRAYERASARNDRRLEAWRAYVASGRNDNFEVGQ